MKATAASLAISLAALCRVGDAAPTLTEPTATVRNGTYVGVQNAHYNQDYFLGIPYAQQPIGNLRFTIPQSLNETWEGTREAKEYSEICVGYGVRPPSLLSKLIRPTN
jgi:triacylglycerol lipase